METPKSTNEQIIDSPVQESNVYVNKVLQLESKHLNEHLFPMGAIQNITYADEGKNLILELSGDVPSNFEPIQIVIVHPDASQAGWIGKGYIGVTITGTGVDISLIPLPNETVDLIKTIYQEYTGQSGSVRYDNTNSGADASRFTLGLYNSIIEKNSERKNSQ